MEKAAYDSLTTRERDCLHLLWRGYGTGEIATQLAISTETVRSHVKNARRKLGGVPGMVAARQLAAFENTPPPLVTPDLGMPNVEMIGQPSDIDNEATAFVSVLREPLVTNDWPDRTGVEIPAQRKGRTNDLSTLQRLGWIALIATCLAILGIAAYPLADSAHDAARRVYPAPPR